MINYSFRLGSIALCALMVACATPATNTQEADAKAVRDVEASILKDIAAKNLDKWVAGYSDDAVVLLPNSPIVKGRDNIKAALKSLLSDPNFALTFESTQAEASKGGDIAYTVGTYSMTFTNPKDKKPITDKGKYLSIFKKQADGTWKLVADMPNSDLPNPGL